MNDQREEEQDDPKARLEAALRSDATPTPLEVLRLIGERIPTELLDVAWESPTTDDDDEAVEEMVELLGLAAWLLRETEAPKARAAELGA